MTTDADQPRQPDQPDQPDQPAEQRHPTAPLSAEQPTEQATERLSQQPPERATEPAPSMSATAGSTAPPPPPPASGTPASAPPPWFAGPPPGYEPAGPGRTTSRLQRSSSDRVIAGVCGGLGRHTGIDPILFRIGFVALVFAAGTGILLYIALAVLMPRDDGQQIWSRGEARNSADGPAYTPPVPRGPRSPVPGVTLAALLIGAGVIALGERYGNWSLTPADYFAMAVAAIGIALLVSAFGPWRRRKAGLIVLGLFLSLGLFVTSTVDARGGFDQASFGQNSYTPASIDQLHDTYQVLMGESTLDLTDLHFTAGYPKTIQVNVTMGSFLIYVPRDADVRVNGDASFGSVSAFGNRDIIDGYYPGTGEGPTVGDDKPEIILNLDVRFGNAEVSRVG